MAHASVFFGGGFPSSYFRLLGGSRIRVELSTGMSRKSRYGRSSRRPFDPNDRCYQCGDRGHYAYDCYRFSKRGRRSRCKVVQHHPTPPNISEANVSLTITLSLPINDFRFTVMVFHVSQEVPCFPLQVSVSISLQIKEPPQPFTIPKPQL